MITALFIFFSAYCGSIGFGVVMNALISKASDSLDKENEHV